MQRQECFKNDLAEIAALLGIGGKATTEEIPSAPAYGFIARNSLFPDPKHCSFFHSTPAQIFDLQYTKTDGFSAKVSARSAQSTAMVMQATVPPKASQRRDPAPARSSVPGRTPNYGKISGTGLYIKYHPGPNYFSPLTAARHKLTNEYATARNSTTFCFHTTNFQCLAGFARKNNRQEITFRNETEQYCTVPFIFGQVQYRHTKASILGETLRQEFYYGFRKPPPYRDKPSGTEFNSTVQTKGATLRSEHYEAFRRPPPYRDKCW